MRKIICYMGVHKFTERYEIGQHLYKENTVRILEICSFCGKSRVRDETTKTKIIYHHNKPIEVISTTYNKVG